jgi:uncharacterized protein YndB with AHSA1/START domain
MSGHGTYETIEGKPALRFERRLAHPVGAVWRALIEPDRLRQWFPSTVSGDFTLGGRLRFGFEQHDVPDMEGEVTELEPPRLLAFHWGEDHLRFELEPDGDGCRLRFTCVLDARDKAARDAAGWHVCLDRLAAAASDWQALYEDYADNGFPAGAPIPG